MSARIPTTHEVHDSKFSLRGGLEVLTSIYGFNLPIFGILRKINYAPSRQIPNNEMISNHTINILKISI
jgi:hypothetical protein